MKTNLFSFAVVVASTACLAAMPGCSSQATDDSDSAASDLQSAIPMEQVLSGVAPGTSWAALSPSVKRNLQRNADVFLRQVRHDWGAAGLVEKEARILDAPTAPMIDNYDRVIKYFVASEVPDAFKPSTDVVNADLTKALKKLYLVYCAARRDYLPTTNPDWKDWDGGDVRELLVADESTLSDQRDYVTAVESELKAIPDAQLTPVELAIRNKVYFFTRQVKRGSTGYNYGGDDMHQTGVASGFLYNFATEFAADGSRIISDPEYFLQALNAFTFLTLKYENVGTVDTFDWNLKSFVDPDFLAGSNFDPKTLPVAARYVTLSNWWNERVHADSAASRSCTVYSSSERASLWDAFTADNLTNADGKVTMDSYAAGYSANVTAQLASIKVVALATLDSAFPVGSPLLTATQKTAVVAAINAETKPAAILDTMSAALDTATGGTAASASLKASVSSLTFVGGTYNAGDPVSASDAAIVNAMWEDVKAYIKKHYSGYKVDIASLLPAAVILTSGSDTYTGTQSGQVAANLTVGLGKQWSKASLYSTLLHEGKHAIDFASHAPIQGAAWEGGGEATEALVTSKFIDEVMVSEAAKLPYYRLNIAIDNVRVTATTDATLKVFLRTHCRSGEPNSIDFVKNIIAGYGYSDPATQLLRSERAHQGTQYLSYELGKVLYIDLINYLQAQVGASVVVDPYLLQACGVSSSNQDAATVAALKTCLKLP